MIGKVIPKKRADGRASDRVGGRFMLGLVAYLVGPGKDNEHTEPHLISGTETLIEGFAGTDWDEAKTSDLVAQVDRDWRLARWGKGLSLHAPEGERDATGAANPDHVFHATLSLHADEGALSDETWAQVAQDYMRAMEFIGVEGKADCRWIAVRHGLSKAGNDHVHLVASMVREDGTRWAEWKWKSKSRAAVDVIEARYGLRPVKDVAADRGREGYTQAEAAKAKRDNRDELVRDELTRKVRAVAAMSESEADFVDTAREVGLLMRARYAPGDRSKVVGYSVALPAAEKDKGPIWYGGGRLDYLLALPQLRERWEGSDQARAEALASWNAQTTSGPVRSRSAPAGSRQQWSVEAAREVALVNRTLSTADPRDRATWVPAAREASMVLAAAAMVVEPGGPGELSRAADALARAALPRRDESIVPVSQLLMTGRHLRLLARAADDRSGAAWAAVLRQVAGTVKALHSNQILRQELARARVVADQAVPRVVEVRNRLATIDANSPILAAAMKDAAQARTRPQQGTTQPAPGRLGASGTPPRQRPDDRDR